MAISFAVQLQDFGKRVEEDLDKFAGETVREVGRRLIIRSPVDTGLFRSNWFYSYGAPDGATTADTGLLEVNNIGAIPLKGAAEGVHYLQNRLPYAWILETGSSKQAPQGIVGLTALEFESILDTVAGRVRR